MMKPTIIKIKVTYPHPNADRMQLTTIMGMQVVIPVNISVGDKVLFFRSDMVLTPEYLHNNNLYESSDRNKDITVRGCLGRNGHVKAKEIRGEMSVGFTMPVDTWDGKTEICSKWINPHYKSKLNKKTGCKQNPPRAKSYPLFYRHWGTPQFDPEKHNVNDFAFVEEKIHGTSGRTGKLPVMRPWWKFWAPKVSYEVISGTRRREDIHGSFYEHR